MNVRLITQYEISERQQQLRSEYLRTQDGFSISGIRRLMGNTIIAMGQRIHGKLENRCERAARITPFAPARGI